MTDLADALAAARLLALDPAGLGGMLIRGGELVRDAVLAELAATLPEGAPVRRLPISVDDERLLGGLDLGATLATGAPVMRAGLLAEVDGGVLIVPMAERLGEGVAAHLCAALDRGEVAGRATRFLVVAFDDGRDEDDAVPPALAERLGFWVDLSEARPESPHPPTAARRAPPSPASGRGEEGAALSRLREREGTRAAGVGRVRVVAATDPVTIETIAATAAMLGIDSLRAPLFALRASRAAAALDGRDTIAEEDVARAARLTLGPRATRLPPTEEATPETADSPPPPPPEAEQAGDSQPLPDAPIEDLVLAAALASLPKGLLAEIAAGGRKRGRASRGRGKGERRRSPTRGRPAGVRGGLPRGGLRLALIDTLRAAAPWQRVRGAVPGDRRVRVRRDDLRIRRFETRAEATTIFAVDASGSSALARLAEAKGAVELLLAEAYVKRAQVALVAFRGERAELLLPPTRSLVRAKRELADLPGGGGTPLAAGLAAAHELAAAAKKRGRTPFLVVLTDGRANIAADGSANRAAAEADALAAARSIGASGVKGAFVDISPRPRAEGERLAAAMGARYLALPRADARTMHAAVKAAQG